MNNDLQYRFNENWISNLKGKFVVVEFHALEFHLVDSNYLDSTKFSSKQFHQIPEKNVYTVFPYPCSIAFLLLLGKQSILQANSIEIMIILIITLLLTIKKYVFLIKLLIWCNRDWLKMLKSNAAQVMQPHIIFTIISPFFI